MTTPEATGALFVVTPGEPAGIGPDLVVAAAQQPELAATMIVAADPDALRARAGLLGLPLNLQICDPGQRPPAAAEDSLRIWPVPLSQPVQAGVTDVRNAAHVLAALDLAVAACQRGRADAMVTGPVQKSVINEAGHTFSGHTEYLAEATGAPLVRKVAQGDVSLAAARKAKELMLVAGDTHVFPITTLDGAKIGDGRVGPVAAALLRALERDAEGG